MGQPGKAIKTLFWGGIEEASSRQGSKALFFVFGEVA
jgi:hypothetical protein